MINALYEFLVAFAKAALVVGFLSSAIFTVVVAWCVLRHNSLPGDVWRSLGPDVLEMNRLTQPGHPGSLSTTQRQRILTRFLPGMGILTTILLTVSSLAGAPVAPAIGQKADYIKTAITSRPDPVLSATQLATLIKASTVKHIKKFPGRASRNGNNRRDEWLKSDRTIKPGSNRAYAVLALKEYGWDMYQWSCLDRLWWHESGWSSDAGNPARGAYGIPQAYPGSKMAREGKDWRTNPHTQIDWGLRYIEDRYATPCKAFNTWAKRAGRGYGWY